MSFWKTAYRRLVRITSSGRYIPEIDGFRFLAIASVVLFHIDYALTHVAGADGARGAAGNALGFLASRGSVGVELFFIISGFILALPFIEHHAKGAAPVNLKGYYLRRLTRLEPPYIVCLVFFFGMAFALGDRDIGHGTLFTQFFVRLFYAYGLVTNEASLLNGVTWSLEIEVQFYLLVPLLVKVFKLNPSTRRGFLIVLILAGSTLPFAGTRLKYSILNYFQLFLAGFLLADLYLNTPRSSSRAFDGLGVAIALLSIACATSLALLRCLLPVLGLAFFYSVFRARWLNRLFTTQALCVIGGMCYTIYLFHWPFIAQLTKFLADRPLGDDYLTRMVTHTVVILPVLAVVSLFFYVLVERPCMDKRWPTKLAARLRRNPVD